MLISFIVSVYSNHCFWSWFGVFRGSP